MRAAQLKRLHKAADNAARRLSNINAALDANGMGYSEAYVESERAAIAAARVALVLDEALTAVRERVSV